MNSTTRIGTLVLATSLLFGCGTSLGGILGGDDDDRSADTGTGVYGDELRGTVERVDTLDRVVVIDAEGGYSNNLRNGDDLVEVRYDDQTRVEHEGRTYEPADLEPGDRVIVELDRSGNNLFAEEIEVTYDVTQGSSRDDDDRYASDLRGTVRFVDTRDGIVELEPIGDDRGYATGRDGLVILHVDDSTEVEFDGRRYEVTNLERGDEVEVEVRESGSRLIAEEIVVVRDSRNASRY